MKALFVTRSVNRAGYYRCVLPAMFGGYDWAAIEGTPPGLSLISSWVNAGSYEPHFGEYDVVVLQQVRGVKWMNFIKKLRDHGTIVLYEIDDYVHGIRKAVDHDFSGFYDKNALKDMELCMRACDGMICSTEFLADKYRRVMRDRPIWVCKNGLDMGRYRLTKPEKGQVAGRETVTIMWAGATGHQIAGLPWIEAVMHVMRKYDHTSFVSVGQNFARIVSKKFDKRTLSIPFTGLEVYPAAMIAGDIAIAPVGDTDWYKAKSDLRAMEAAALGIPIVAHTHYKSAVTDGETGFIVRTPNGAENAMSALVADDDMRAEMGKKAKQRAIDTFAMEHRVGQWVEALSEAVANKP